MPGRRAGHAITRLWLEPDVQIHAAAAAAIGALDAVVIGPGSFYTSLMPILLVRGAPEAVRAVKGPIVLVTNLLTEGRGMWDFTAGEAVRRIGDVLGRPVDVAIIDNSTPSQSTLGALPRRAQASARTRRRPGVVRGRRRRVLVGRNRPPRSPPAGAGGLGGARQRLL